MNFLGFLAPLLGIIMEWIYKLIPSYGWTLIIFTLLTKILMFPLSVKQQKSTARMSAYQPMMQEIQKKWANDKNRQQEELMKFQQETGMSMTAGCLPMAVNFLVLFGLIEVVYRPLQYILRVPKELIDKAVELANSALGMNLMANNFTVQNDIINAVKRDQGTVAPGVTERSVDLGKVVEIDHQHAGRVSQALALAEEVSPIRQARQLVGSRQALVVMP